MKHYAATPPSWSPPSSSHTITAKPVDKPTSDTETATTRELFPAQNDGGADQHHGGEDHQPHDVPVGDTTLVNNLEARPVRKKKPNSGTMAR